MTTSKSLSQSWRAAAAGFLFAIIALPTPASSAPDGCAKYIVAYWTHHSVGGEFNGDRVLSSVNGEFAVPRLSDGNGYGLAFGGRTRWVGIELGYWRSEHDATWLDQSADGTHQMLGAEGRFFPVVIGVLRPFVSGGAFMEWLTADNAYCSSVADGTCRERFNGFGLSLGGGVEAQLTERFFLTSYVQYRHSQYDSVKSLDISDGTLSYTLDGGGWSIRTGLGLQL